MMSPKIRDDLLVLLLACAGFAAEHTSVVGHGQDFPIVQQVPMMPRLYRQ